MEDGIRDLTQTIKNLMASNSEWRRTFDAIDEAIALLDAEGRILRCNNAFAALVNKPFSEIIGEICQDICICFGVKRKGCPVMACKSTLKREKSVFNHGERWFEISGNPISDESGQYQGAVHILRDITERKQMEDTLKNALAKAENEKVKTESILEAISYGVSIQDRNFRILYQNQAHKKIIGEHAGELCYLAYEKREEQCEGCGIAQVFADGETHKVQRSASTENGIVHVEIAASPLRDAEGNIIAGIEVVHDVTEQKKAEEVLRSKEYFLSEAQRIAKIGSWQRDLKTDHVIWSDELFRILGLDPHNTQADFNMFMNLIHPDDREKQKMAVAEAIQNNQPYNAEYRILKADGGQSIIHAHGEIMFDESGSPAYIRGTVQDITERRLAEEELFRIQKDWEYTFNSITDMVTVHDKDYNIILANKAAEKILGLPMFDELKDRKCFSYYHGTDHPPAGCPSCGCLQSGMSASFETFEPHLGMFIEIRAIPRFDSGGSLIGLIHIVRDITERKKSEAERERLNHEKEQLREQLLQSQKMEAVGTLAGGIAHDFNNILNVIIGYSGLLENINGIDGRAREFLSEITNAANRAAYLTKGLLAFSRRQQLELRPSDLNDIIRSITAMLHRIIGEDIRVDIKLCGDNPVIICDSGQIEQVIVNLVTNARDAMPNGGMLNITTETVFLDEESCKYKGFDSPGRYALMRIADTGIGMDEETVERIFEPFFTTKPVGKGTGLGLSIIYGIVAQHKGHIECNSALWQGTVFSVYMPLAELQMANVNEDVKMYAATKGMGELILVGEDDESGRRLIRVVLEHHGYRVIEASNGVEVIEQFNANHKEISLLLLDVIMPDMNGYDALQLIKQQYPEVKAVFMSGYTADILAQRGIGDMSVPLLKKPVSPHELMDIVRNTLDFR